MQLVIGFVALHISITITTEVVPVACLSLLKIMKLKTYHINTPIIHILFWHGTITSLKGDGVKLVLWPKSSNHKCGTEMMVECDLREEF